VISAPARVRPWQAARVRPWQAVRVRPWQGRGRGSPRSWGTRLLGGDRRSARSGGCPPRWPFQPRRPARWPLVVCAADSPVPGTRATEERGGTRLLGSRPSPVDQRRHRSRV